MCYHRVRPKRKVGIKVLSAVGTFVISGAPTHSTAGTWRDLIETIDEELNLFLLVH